MLPSSDETDADGKPAPEIVSWDPTTGRVAVNRRAEARRWVPRGLRRALEGTDYSTNTQASMSGWKSQVIS